MLEVCGLENTEALLNDPLEKFAACAAGWTEDDDFDALGKSQTRAENRDAAHDTREVSHERRVQGRVLSRKKRKCLPEAARCPACTIDRVRSCQE